MSPAGEDSHNRDRSQRSATSDQDRLDELRHSQLQAEQQRASPEHSDRGNSVQGNSVQGNSSRDNSDQDHSDPERLDRAGSGVGSNHPAAEARVSDGVASKEDTDVLHQRAYASTGDPDQTRMLQERIRRQHRVRPQYVCLIGASAGGLAAIKSFLAPLPDDLGVAYVVVQHLAPDRQTRMELLLSRETDMSVIEVGDQPDGFALQPNHVYVIPPGKDMMVQQFRLFLTDRERGEKLSLPIDHFGRSLAADVGRDAVVVILSGTGSDGTGCLSTIHDAGGLVMAQSPSDAAFDSMPQSVIASGLCDVSGSASSLADALVRYVRGNLSREQMARLLVGEGGSASSTEILDALRIETGVDFNVYKPQTVIRRIARRMELLKISDVDQYRTLIEDDSVERDALLGDLLIGVTQFNRNPGAFEACQKLVIETLIQRRSDGDAIRVWVPGCSTGEEAYTLAILFNEAISASGRNLTLQLFATDVHQQAVDAASKGVFDGSAVSRLDPVHVAKYFELTEDGRHKIRWVIRQQIVFVCHNCIDDPPFTRMDFVSCRNLLIYLQPHAQNKALSLFHFALSVGGFLMLGSSESIGSLEREFQTVDEKWRIFRKSRDVQLVRLNQATMGRRVSRDDSAWQRPASDPMTVTSRTSPQLIAAYELLVSQSIPGAFMIDQSGMLLHTFGRGGEYLKVSTGRHSNLLSDLILYDLKAYVAAATAHCSRENATIRYDDVEVKTPSSTERLSVIATPMSVGNTAGPYLMISLTEAVAETPTTEPSNIEAGSQDDRMRSLEFELNQTQIKLQDSIETVAIAKEQIQARNQELATGNEELQSVNEELQSVNEELHSINAEFHDKIEQLQRLNDDMNNLMRNSTLAVMVLDGELNLRRFTPMVARMFEFRHTDLDRPISQFRSPLIEGEVYRSFEATLDDGETRHRWVDDESGKKYQCAITPFESARSGGVVVTYTPVNLTDDQIRQLIDQDQSS